MPSLDEAPAPGHGARARNVVTGLADLVAVLALLAVLAFPIGLPPVARYPLAALLLFWVPGYLFAEVLWPWRRAPVDDLLEYVGLTIGLSLVFAPLVSVPLFFGDRLTPGTMLAAFSAVVLALLTLALVRRFRAPRPARAPREIPRRSRGALVERFTAIAFGAALVFAAVSVHASVTERDAPRAPEAWLTDADGALLPHPLHVETNASLDVHVHVRVHDAPVSFEVIQVLELEDGEESRRVLQLNATPGTEAVLPLNLTAPATEGEGWLRVRLEPVNGDEHLTLTSFVRFHDLGGRA